MTIRGKLSPVNRAVAYALAIVWLSGGAVGLVIGLGHAQVVVVIVATGAIVYGSLWLRVAARSRLLTWRELIEPWRT